MASSSADASQKRSRVLAALSGDSGIYGGSQPPPPQLQPDPLYNPLKRSHEETTAESSKRRVTGEGVTAGEGSESGEYPPNFS